MQICPGNLDVITKDRVEFHFQRRDTGALPFSLLDLRKILLAVAAEVAEFVEILVHAGRNDPSVGETDGRLGHDGLVNARPQISKFVNRAIERCQALCRQASQGGADRRNLSQRDGKRLHVARIRCFQGYTAEQALQIENAVKRLPQLLASDGVFSLGFHRVQTQLDFCQINRRPQHPGAKQALAHGSDGRIQTAEQGHPIVVSSEQWLNQLQVANGDRIEHQAGLALIKSDAIDMVQLAALGGMHIMKNRSRGRGCGCLARKPEAFEGKHTKMVLQQRNGVVGSEDPVVKRSRGALSIVKRRPPEGRRFSPVTRPVEKRSIRSVEQFLRP